MSILSALDRPIAFHRIFAQIATCPCAGLFLSQAWYWSFRTNDPDGWFWKTTEQWQEETVLSKRQQQTARKKLIKLEILEVERRGLPAKNYYRIDKKKLETLVLRQMGETVQLDGRNGPTSGYKTVQLDDAKRSNILYTENTSENTSLEEAEIQKTNTSDLIGEPNERPLNPPPFVQPERASSPELLQADFVHPTERLNNAFAAKGKPPLFDWRTDWTNQGIYKDFAKYFAATEMATWDSYKLNQRVPMIGDARVHIPQWEKDLTKLEKLKNYWESFERRQARLNKAPGDSCIEPEILEAARAATSRMKKEVFQVSTVDLSVWGA